MQNNIKRLDAENLINQFFPIINYFEEHNIEYCIVGGIAVLIHCYINNLNDFRETMDVDFLVSKEYSNKNIAEDYLSIFCNSNKEKEQLKLIILGEAVDLQDLSNSFESISIEGAVEKLDGFNTPNIDICRTLNNVDISNIEKERISVLGKNVWVATVEQLITMKKNVIDLYGNDPLNSPRFHDYIDLKLLQTILGKLHEKV